MQNFFGYRFIRVILIAIPVVVFFWLLAKEFVLTGTMTVRYDFSRDTPFIKRLWPPGRVDPIERDATGDAFQRIRIDPVTFDVLLPRAFRDATVRVWYQKSESQPFFVGIQQTRAAWKPGIVPVRKVGTMGKWHIGEARFDVLSRFEFTGNKYQFVISAPTLNRQVEPLTVTAIELELTRESFTFGNFFPRLWHFFFGR